VLNGSIIDFSVEVVNMVFPESLRWKTSEAMTVFPQLMHDDALRDVGE
jgi:hypothetical protein